jgi:C4-dicarboxylate-specific signal transduction histidine kinase
MLAIDANGMALLSALVEALPHPVYVQEMGSGAFLYGNTRFRELFDISPPPVVNGEFHDAGKDRWYVLHSHALCWIDGRRAALCVLTDVTEERRARALIAKHRDAAHRTARLIALGEFASAVAHELNQPLAAIATYNHSCMRMLQAGKADPEQLLQAMHICRDQAKRAGRIIQRLRGLLRHPGPALAEQDLNELVAAVLELSEPGAREAGVSFERALSAQPPLVRADRLLIEQAALNLVRNAVEAVQDLPPERRRVTVATRVEADGSGTLAISDLGEGVPTDVHERLFDPFVTTKRGGLGLGLSICRSVVEAHGGVIHHEKNAACGASFAFTLPR